MRSPPFFYDGMATSAKIRKNPETNVAGAEISGNYASRRLLSLQNCLRRNFRFSVFLTVFRSRGGLFGHAAWPASDGFRRCSMAGRALRLFQSMIFVVFVTAAFVRKCCCFPAVRASLGRDGGLAAVQRGACCNAAGPLRQSREGLMDPHLGPFQGEGEQTPFICNCE